MIRSVVSIRTVAAVLLALGLAGCAEQKPSTPSGQQQQASGKQDTTLPTAAKGDTKQATTEPAAKSEDEDAAEIAAVRAKLSPEDRKLVDAQEWCANSPDERLGAMGAPIKVMIDGKPVFICCKGCEKAIKADPKKTLDTVAQLKAKKAAMK